MLLIVVALIVGGVALYRRHAIQQRHAAEQAALETQLSTSKRAADEDVTKFGEELQRLDSDVAGHALDEAMQQDYQRALDAYDNAKMSLDAVTKPEEIRHVTEILEDGRYAVACVKARIAGEPLPAKRPPCFFNPAHGPSSQDVTWAPPGGVPRSVPACPADAERVLAGADPYIRTVQVGPQRVPYWEGGPAYAPWARIRPMGTDSPQLQHGRTHRAGANAPDWLPPRVDRRLTPGVRRPAFLVRRPTGGW